MSEASPRANRSYLTPGPWMLELITKIHIRLYEATGGFLGSGLYQLGEPGTSLFRKMDALILTTIGRKSGEKRKVPLPYFKYDDRIFVVASNAGSTKNPAWFHNLKANPDVTVMIGPDTFRARARSLEDAEYDAMWKRHKTSWPRWQIYEEKTPRKIPLVEIVVERK